MSDVAEMTDESPVLCLPSALRQYADGRARLPLPGSTVAAMLDALGTAVPALERRIRDEQGSVRRHLNLYVGDTDVRDLAGLQTEVGPATEVYVVTAVSGG